MFEAKFIENKNIKFNYHHDFPYGIIDDNFILADNFGVLTFKSIEKAKERIELIYNPNKTTMVALLGKEIDGKVMIREIYPYFETVKVNLESLVLKGFKYAKIGSDGSIIFRDGLPYDWQGLLDSSATVALEFCNYLADGNLVPYRVVEVG